MTAEAERWKEYNSYELRDHKNKTKERLKDEINNISHRIATQRAAVMNATTYGKKGMSSTNYGDWKAPEIEQINRNFNEASRFYNTHKAARKHGLKYVPPPVAENVQQLLDE